MEGEAGECALPHIACLGVHTLRLQLCLRQMYAVQLIKALEAARGNGTSMISLIMPPKDQVRPVTAILWTTAADRLEYQT